MKSLSQLFKPLLLLAVMVCASRLQAQPTSYVWRNVEINGGGFVTGIIFHPQEHGLVYARTDIGGAYRWNDETKRWIPLTDQFGPENWNYYGIESLAVDPSDANRLYAAVGTYTNDWAGNGAILRSTDRGEHWQITPLPFKNGGNEPGRSTGERLIVDPTNGKTLFFGSRRNGLWKSIDFGANWEKVTSFPAPNNENGFGITFLTFDANHTLYAGVASGSANLFQSKDAGVTWTPVAGAPQGFFPHHAVFASDGTLYLSYSNGSGPNDVTDGAVWKRDKAEVWSKISPVSPGGNDRFGFAGLSVDAQNPQTLMVSTLDRWGQGDDIFRSTDGGTTWKSVKASSSRDSSAAPYLNWGKDKADLGHWIGDLEIDPFNSSHVLYVTGATVWGSDNVDALDKDGNSNWSVRAAGIEEVSVTALISPSVGPHLVSGVGDIGGFVHDDLTVSPVSGMMSNPRLSHNSSLDYAPEAPGVLVRCGNGQGSLSLNSGANWSEFAGKPTDPMDGASIAVSADGGSFVWSNSKAGNSFLSADHGATWTVCQGLPGKSSVISDRALPGVFYSLNQQLFVSRDGGAHFSAVPTNVPQGAAKLFSSPHGGGDLWLAGRGGLFHSLDGGSHWAGVATVTDCAALGFGKAGPGANYESIFLVGKVQGSYGVFRSNDAAETWTRINDDNHQWGNIDQAITGDPRVYGRVYIATNGRGIIWGDLKN